MRSLLGLRRDRRRIEMIRQARDAIQGNPFGQPCVPTQVAWRNFAGGNHFENLPFGVRPCFLAVLYYEYVHDFGELNLIALYIWPTRVLSLKQAARFFPNLLSILVFGSILNLYFRFADRPDRLLIIVDVMPFHLNGLCLVW